MEQADLRELWADNKDRPQFVREHRESFAEHLSDTTAGHLPSPAASTFEYRRFLEQYKGQVTRQLAESTTTDDAETEDE